MSLSEAEQAELDRLQAEFEAAGGRGVELAERIDQLQSWAEGPPCRRLEVEFIKDLPNKDVGDFTYGTELEEIAADNYRRATFGAAAVKAYAAVTMPGNDESPRTAIGDLLSDLRHLCDVLGFDFEEFIERSAGHYKAETRGEV